MSNSLAMVSPRAFITASSPKGMAQPPWVNRFLRSSSGPPGPCMTPSSVTWVIAMIFLMISLSFDTTQRDIRPRRASRPPRRKSADETITIVENPISTAMNTPFGPRPSGFASSHATGSSSCQKQPSLMHAYRDSKRLRDARTRLHLSGRKPARQGSGSNVTGIFMTGLEFTVTAQLGVPYESIASMSIAEVQGPVRGAGGLPQLTSRSGGYDERQDGARDGQFSRDRGSDRTCVRRARGCRGCPRPGPAGSRHGRGGDPERGRPGDARGGGRDAVRRGRGHAAVSGRSAGARGYPRGQRGRQLHAARATGGAD